MSDLRRQIAAALTSGNLAHSPIIETAIERIGALAFADRLGGLLWKLKWANDRAAYEPALHLLVKRVRKPHEARSLPLELCRQCLHEWLNNLCRKCAGRGSVADRFGVRRACYACDGRGFGSPSQHERARAIGVDLGGYRRWESRFEAVHQYIRAADLLAWNDIAAQLERIEPHGLQPAGTAESAQCATARTGELGEE